MSLTFPIRRIIIVVTASLIATVLLRQFIATAQAQDYETDFVWPAANSHTAPVTTTIGISLPFDVDASTVTSQTFTLSSDQQGRLDGEYKVTNGVASFQPETAFYPGERIEATITAAISDTSHTQHAEPIVWRFRTATLASGKYARSRAGLISLVDSRAVAIGDLNGDSYLDLVAGPTYHYPGEAVQSQSIWINDGEGCFSYNGVSLSSASTDAYFDLSPQKVALADLDGDGDLDAGLAGYQYLRIWMNDGSAVFSLVLDEDMLYTPLHDIEFGDVDADGDLDGVMTAHCPGMTPECDFAKNLIWLNDGTGTLVRSDRSIGYGESADVDMGDLDRDGDLDAIQTTYQGHVIRTWLNDGLGYFTEAYTVTSLSIGLADLGDLDDDNDLDVVQNAEMDRPDVWLNSGDGSLLPGQTISGVYVGWTADINADGELDIFSAEYIGKYEPNAQINDGSAHFTLSDPFPDGVVGEVMAAGDLDNDGDVDYLVGGHDIAPTVLFDTANKRGPTNCHTNRWLPFVDSN